MDSETYNKTMEALYPLFEIHFWFYVEVAVFYSTVFSIIFFLLVAYHCKLRSYEYDVTSHILIKDEDLLRSMKLPLAVLTSIGSAFGTFLVMFYSIDEYHEFSSLNWLLYFIALFLSII